MQTDESQPDALKRRGFLKAVIVAGGAVISAAVAVPGVGLLLRPVLKGMRTRKARLILPDGVSPREGFVAARYEGQEATAPAIMVHQEENGEVVAFSAKCTHAGCSVAWRADKKEFFCPCHQGHFDASGKVTGGPPPRPLERLNAHLEGDAIIIEVPEA